MGLDSTARQTTEDEKQRLRLQEKNIINDLVNTDGGLASKLQAWAQIVEELINYADTDYNFAVSQISTYIRRECHKLHLKFTHNVDRYLSEKYKNPNMARLYHVEDGLETAICPQLEDKPIEQYSMMEMEFELEYLEKTDNDSDKLLMLLNNRKEDIYREAIRRGYDSIAGKKIRDQISARDYRWEIPQDAELDQLYNETIKQCERVIHGLDIFIHKNYPEYRTPEKEKERQYGNSFRVWANMLAIVNEKKWSGEVDFWLGRDYWLEVQSAHKSGNSTMYPTTLCAYCSRDVQDNPKDFHVSKYDKSSPTGYKCDACGGYEIILRNNSREQVGDKHEENQRMAEDIVNHIPYYVDIFKDWRVRTLNPAIYARKHAISKEFEIASFGKEKIVVPRKKATK